jgi:hypothetical protein
MPMPCGHKARAKPPLRVVLPINPPSFPSRAPAVAPVHRRPPLTPLVSSLLRLCPWPTNDSKLLPNLHSSSHNHPWLSSAIQCIGIRAVAAVPPLSCRQPSPEPAPTPPPPPNELRWAPRVPRAICWPSPAGYRRRRALLYGGGAPVWGFDSCRDLVQTQGHLCEVSNLSKGCWANRFLSSLPLGPMACKNHRKS